jgi:hypothetical protein
MRMIEQFIFEGCERPQVQLVGMNANPYSIFARCHEAVEKIWNKKQWDIFYAEAESRKDQPDGYDHLIRTVYKYFDLIDDEESIEFDDEEFEDEIEY